MFHPRPFVSAAIAFCGGIAIGRLLFGIWPSVAVAVFLLLALSAYVLAKRRLIPILLAVVIGILRIQAAIPAFAQAEQSTLLTGRVCETPIDSADGCELILDGAACSGVPVRGRVLLTLYGAPRDHIRYGQTLSVTASISPLTAHDTYYLSSRICATAKAHAESALMSAPQLDLYGMLLRLREQMVHALDDLFGDNAALATGMLLGDKSEIPHDAMSAFRTTGSAHLLAVSGLHVGILCGALLFVLRRRTMRTQFFIVAGFLFVYCALTGFAPSCIRASIMTLCLLLAKTLGRRNDSLSALALAACILLFINPFWLYAIGFQLSFCAVLGILLVHRPLYDACHRLPQGLREGVSVSISAQAGIVPVTLAHFERLPLLSPIVNLLVVPLAPLFVVPAFVSLLLYGLSPVLAHVPALFADAILTLMQGVVRVFARVDQVALPPLSTGACVLFVLGLAFLSRYCLLPLKQKQALGAVCFVLCLLLTLLLL